MPPIDCSPLAPGPLWDAPTDAPALPLLVDVNTAPVSVRVQAMLASALADAVALQGSDPHVPLSVPVGGAADALPQPVRLTGGPGWSRVFPAARKTSVNPA